MVTTTTGIATSFIQFSRASLATVTNNVGNIAWAGHNLLTNSESFDAAAWSKAAATVTANSIAAPNGTNTADSILDTAVNNIHYVGQSISSLSPAGLTFTVSAFLRANTLNFATLGISDISSGSLYAVAVFNLSTGAVATTGAVGTGYSVVGTPTITSVGNNWYLCTVTVTAGTSVSFLNAVIGANKTGVITASAGGFESYLGNGSGVYAWGASLYRADLGGMVYNPAQPAGFGTYYPTTPKNLLGYTEAFNSWTKTNATVTSDVIMAPNGLQVADKVVSTTATGYHAVSQGLILTAARYVLSFYAKAAEYTLIRVSDGAANRFYLSYDLASGSVIAGSTGGSKYISSSITSAGDGWYRCSVTFQDISAGSSPSIIGYPAGATPDVYGVQYTGDGTSGIYLWGAQLSDSASIDPYSPVYAAAPTSSAYYAPRLDYSPTTIQPLGMLVEEQRTNLLFYSSEFSNAYWTKQTVTIGASGVAPDGTTTASLLIPSSTPNVQQLLRLSIVASSTCAMSIYAKASGINTFEILDGASGVNGGIFNLSTGVATNKGTGVASMVPVGNGWYRCTSVATTTGFRLYCPNSSGTASGDGTSGIYIWGAQVEAGSFATSYIPTGASTVTRSADVASVSTQAFPYSETEGALVVATQYAGVVSGYQYSTGLSTGSGVSNIASLASNSGTMSARVRSGGSDCLDANLAAATVGGIRKVAIALKANDFAAVLNGGSPVTSTTGAMPVGIVTLNVPVIGSQWIRQITYLPRRISNTELQTRTTL